MYLTGDASVPTIGLTASDSPLDVVMPESLSADVPTIGDGTPEAIDAVVSPSEWLKEKDDALIATLAGAGKLNRLLILHIGHYEMLDQVQ